MTAESDDVVWTRTHRACFQVAPLIEMRGKKKLQVGEYFTATTADERAGLSAAERKLIAMGLRAGHW